LVRAHKFHSGGAFLKGAEGERRLIMPSRVGAPNTVRHGVGEWRFQQRIKHDWHAALKLAADAVFEYWKSNPFDHLVVGSLPGEPIKEIEGVLHDYLSRILLGYIEINPATADENEVWNKLLDFRIQKDREEERELIKLFKEELGAGSMVGSKIRFQDRTDKATRIKFMTDGILLAETRKDRQLLQYDTLIIDEAHERSLNIDFTLGYLRDLLRLRDDLKIIVSSATLDSESFSAPAESGRKCGKVKPSDRHSDWFSTTRSAPTP
jgi:peptide subunit release factor 1 (eRF1)